MKPVDHEAERNMTFKPNMSATADKFLDVQPKYMKSKNDPAVPEKHNRNVLIIGRKDSPDRSVKTQVRYVNAKLKLSSSEAITPMMLELGMKKPETAPEGKR